MSLCFVGKFLKNAKNGAYMAKQYRFSILIISGLIVSAAGLLARITNENNIEHWFVFAAGLSNLIVLFDLGPEIFESSYARSARLWLTFELFFFSTVLGVDVSVAFSEYEDFLLAFSILWVGFALFFMAYSENPNSKVGFLLSALCLVVSLYLMPLLLRRFSPEWDDPIWILISDRGYAWIHLLCIPFVYFIVDSKLSTKHMKWSRFLFLDRSLIWAGAACALSGLLYGLLGPDGGTPPLFESGAAALLLLVGNAWYISIEEQKSVQQIA